MGSIAAVSCETLECQLGAKSRREDVTGCKNTGIFKTAVGEEARCRFDM